MGSGPTFRPATAEDVPTLARHRRLMYEDMRDSEGYRFQDADLDRMETEYEDCIRKQIPQGCFQAWIAEVEGVVVGSGCVTILPWPPGPTVPAAAVGLLHSMYTASKQRKKGIGRGIIDALAAACKSRGCRQIIIGGSGTKAGRHLYETIGFGPSENMRLNL
jgi:GNAT superfamily N-acetyltransferase